jgi:hypothetical protein
METPLQEAAIGQMSKALFAARQSPMLALERA